jgi:hypothetical protein
MAMLRSLAPFALVVVAACRPEPATQDPTPTTTPPADSADEGAAESPPGDDACGENGPCTDGKQCIEYFGFAGPSGPKFYSCEIPCADDKNACPAGQECITIADGPGQVCRPPSELSGPPAKK